MEVANKSVKLKFGPIVSWLSEMTSPPGALLRDGVNLEFELGQLPFSSSNERRLGFVPRCKVIACFTMAEVYPRLY